MTIARPLGYTVVAGDADAARLVNALAGGADGELEVLA